jgi:hypothetical protein
MKDRVKLLLFYNDSLCKQNRPWVSPQLVAMKKRKKSFIVVRSEAPSFPHDGEGGRWKREKEGEGGRSGKACVADQTAGMTEQASTPSSICLSDPQGRDEAVTQERAQNNVKKGSPFWDRTRTRAVRRSPSAHPSLTQAHPAREVRVLKAA